MSDENENTGKAKDLGERLIDLGLVTREQLTLAHSEHRRTGKQLSEVLGQLGFVSQTEIARQLADELHTEFIDLTSSSIDSEVLQLVPADFAKKHQLIPVDRDGHTLMVAMANTFDIMAIDALEKITMMSIEVIASTPQAIHDAIEHNYIKSIPLEHLIDTILKNEVTGSDPPVMQFVDQIIGRAVQKRATDIHLVPQETVVILRFRIDGVLHEELLFPKAIQQVVTARIKIMSGFDVTEHRLPQDGKIRFRLGHKQVDLRVSSLPTQYGESIVIRVLDKSSISFNLKKMGLSKNDQMLLLDAIGNPHGIILATGPTGSGKTTTLYAALNRMDAIHNSIFTLEDPVEYALANVRQTQINADIGMTFASGLRALLRQDPDIILVGEIRDEETAQLAIRAALTGHLVFSTLHTNCAAGAIPRFMNMGIEPFLLKSTIVSVIAQRLVRKVCPFCAEVLESTQVEQFAQQLQFTPKSTDKFRAGKGCGSCHKSGYIGRVAVYEILHGKHLRDVKLKPGINEDEILAGAREAGMRTMMEDGIAKARKGICSLEDLTRVIGV
jgi:type IV pilus assembly protein PilB